MPGDEVTPTSIAKVVEADLWVDDPSCPLETLGGGRHEGCVCAVDQRIEIRAAPAELDHQIGIQGGREYIE